MEIIVRKPTESEIEEAQSWPEWSKEVSEFDWSYDEPETCYILEGSAQVTGDDVQPASFATGDWVIFPAGLKCKWSIKENLKKKYKFG